MELACQRCRGVLYIILDLPDAWLKLGISIVQVNTVLKNICLTGESSRKKEVAPTPAVPEPTEAAEEQEFIVEKIIDCRQKNGKYEYFIKWEGYSE